MQSGVTPILGDTDAMKSPEIEQMTLTYLLALILLNETWVIPR